MFITNTLELYMKNMFQIENYQITVSSIILEKSLSKKTIGNLLDEILKIEKDKPNNGHIAEEQILSALSDYNDVTLDIVVTVDNNENIDETDENNNHRKSSSSSPPRRESSNNNNNSSPRHSSSSKHRLENRRTSSSRRFDEI